MGRPHMKNKGSIAYLTHTFPLFSTTFISDEIDEMRRQGADLKLFAIRRPLSDEYPPEFQRFVDETHYIFPLNLLRLIRRHIVAFISTPWGYLSNLGYALFQTEHSLRDRIRSLIYFVEAIYIYPTIKENRCSHIHAHVLTGGASIALFIKRSYGMTFSQTAHGTDIFSDTFLLRQKIANAVFTRVGTEFNRRHLAANLDGTSISPIVVIPFGIEIDRYLSDSGKSKGEGGLRLLTVGRLTWQKAQHLLLEAYSHVLKDFKDIHLTIIGEGEEREHLESLCETLALKGRVSMLGALDKESVRIEYLNSDLFILSSISEGFGIVLLEAMSSGLPVIAPRLNGIPEIIADGISGRLFETGSIEDMARIISELLRDEPQRKRLGKAARKIAYERFQLRNSIDRFYHELRERVDIE